ncbi:MAG: hypothetical protein E7H32_05315 [Anaerococcus sp.]|uniref:hypothetical protein n=1 Tax=Anaerococcus sp. TaxID=1872515 RepID=UPI002907D4E1|nr:hypothetical protein [Anaerococcus sp.]MDU4026088.1 hypothetical protein [Anaerococcus sp.]
MKSKNKTFMYLCLLVALFNIQPSFAKENSESTTTSEQTDIKSGDEIIITEIEPSENTQTTTVTVEEKKPQKPASKKPDESQSDKAENKQRPSPTIDPRAAEVNERVNQKYREEQKYKQKTENKSQPLKKTKTLTKTKKEEISSKEVDALIKELDENTQSIQSKMENIDKNTGKKSKGAEDYKKSVDRVSETIKSDKISKEESKKIAKTTNRIVEEYNKKIEAAKTSAEKEALVKEASERINENLVKVSKNAIDRDKSDDDSIYDQKNESLVLEIEADSKDKGNNIEVSKTTSLEKSPRLTKDNKFNKYLKLSFALFIVLLLVLSISLAYVLKNKDNKVNKS